MAYKFVLKKILNDSSDENHKTLGEYKFTDSLFTIGSEEANNLVIADAAREQAVIINEGDHLRLINSAEGTSLNDVALRREAIQILKHGDKVSIGKRLFLLVVNEESELPIPTGKKQEETDAYETTKEITSFEIAPINESPYITTVTPRRRKKAPTNFSDVLDTLRTEEDSFYFIVKRGEQEIGRVPIRDAETPIGKNERGIIAFNENQIETQYGIAYKDWGGILIKAARPNSVHVNGKPLENDQRLRNSDRLTFSSAPKGISLVLHEPSLLVALEPLLNNSNNISGKFQNPGGLANIENEAVAVKKAPVGEKRYFGYFSFLEVLTMVIGTLITAVVFFLLFELIFS